MPSLLRKHNNEKKVLLNKEIPDENKASVCEIQHFLF
jgi:hypothetical protein